MSHLAEACVEIFGNERVRSSLLDRLTYASDAGFYELIPKVVVQPASLDDVSKLFEISFRYKVPVVFRTGGTSLSGQSITDGILADLSQEWRGIKVSEGEVQVQPGITGGMVNHYLKKHGAKIGPDPASVQAAMMGGIIANNASGMCCGVKDNAYHTLKHIEFMLCNGNVFNTANANDYQRFIQLENVLSETLSQCRAEILESELSLQTIRTKYQIKNTIGYALNAFVDFEHPLDIMAHLLVGSEGTLAFIAKATLYTIPDKPFKAAALLLFPTVKSACQSIDVLAKSGAEALELLDYASLQSVQHLAELPQQFRNLPQNACALLCEYQAEDEERLSDLIQKGIQLSNALSLLFPAEFETNEERRMLYWKIRKGIFPSIGAVRKRGTTVVLEDVAVPVPNLATLVESLHELFEKHDYDNAIIFGHAKDGNLHFVLTQNFAHADAIAQYEQLMQDVVALVLRLNGSLKAEHGTGRNMAPFVETEWGGDLYSIMQRVKQAADPYNLLNPGVIINADKQIHLKNLKPLPLIEAEADKCIECGFCEPVCPSRDITMTPRRRIVARRALRRPELFDGFTARKDFLHDYQYQGLQTCATDGLCASECPVQIDTGDLVKRLRNEKHGRINNLVANLLSRNFKTTESVVRFIIRIADKLNSRGKLTRATGRLRKHLTIMPRVMQSMQGVGEWRTTENHQPDFIYYTSCINRTMQSGSKPLQQTIHELCELAGIRLSMPKQISGTCCGQPFASKGYGRQGIQLHQALIDKLWNWSDGGRIPIVIDFTSCTYTLIKNATNLSAQLKQKQTQLRLLDSIEFLHDDVLPKLTLKNKSSKVAIHPTCSAGKLKLSHKLFAIAQAAAEEVIKPAYSGCCGMAGDRGMLTPELTKAATAMEVKELAAHKLDGAYSSASTCQMALTEFGGPQFDHIAELLLKACR